MGSKLFQKFTQKKSKEQISTFEHDTFTIGPNSSFDLNAVINVGEAKNKNKFVEYIIHFESVEEMEALNSDGKKKKFPTFFIDASNGICWELEPRTNP